MSSMSTRAVAVLLALLVAPHAGAAECVADTDCPPPELCLQGACQQPTRRTPVWRRSGRDFSARVTEAGDPTPGWAIPGAIAGFSSAAAVLGLGIAAEALQGNADAVVSLGFAAAGITAAAGPVTFVASRSARGSHPRVRGVGALRVIGWIAWGGGVGATAGVALITLVSDAPPPLGVAGVAAVLATASLTMFSIDALVAGTQAERVLEQRAGGSVTLAPVVGPYRGHDGRAGGLLGVAGSF